MGFGLLALLPICSLAQSVLALALGYIPCCEMLCRHRLHQHSRSNLRVARLYALSIQLSTPNLERALPITEPQGEGLTPLDSSMSDQDAIGITHGVVSFSVTALFFRSFYVTDVTVARNGCSCGSHALYVLQRCQAA